MTAKRPENILQFRVSLDHLEPRIWRRIQVPDSFTLQQLHRVVQLVMGWQDSHLHEFILSGKRYGEPNAEDEENVIDERAVRLRDLALSNGDGIGYVYDFGDNWQHQLVLEAEAGLASAIPLSQLYSWRAQHSARGRGRDRWLRRVPGRDHQPGSRGT